MYQICVKDQGHMYMEASRHQAWKTVGNAKFSSQRTVKHIKPLDSSDSSVFDLLKDVPPGPIPITVSLESDCGSDVGYYHHS